MDEFDLVARGGSLPREEVARLEALVRTNRAALEAYGLLAGYYFLHQQAPGTSAKRRAVIRWFVKNRAGADVVGSPFFQIHKQLDTVGYRAVRAMWLKVAARSKDVAVLKNAARFFTLSEPARATTYLERAEQLQPLKSEWKRRLGSIWRTRAFQQRRTQPRQAAIQRALSYFAKAHQLSEGALFKWYMLASLAELALHAGALGRAKRYAEALLAQAPLYQADWNYGNAIHNGNQVLGVIALQQRKRQKAIEHLAAAGATPGSPQLGSFGPSFQLAQALLDIGERDAVRSYLERCKAFWSMGQHELTAWLDALRAGESPRLERR